MGLKTMGVGIREIRRSLSFSTIICRSVISVKEYESEIVKNPNKYSNLLDMYLPIQIRELFQEKNLAPNSPSSYTKLLSR
jgi:hypothetical protein